MSGRRLSISEAAERIEPRLRIPEETTSSPVLIIVSGLPGTGKSHLSRRIADALPVALLQTDLVRKTLFRRPTYSAEESAFVYGVCHEIIASLLNRGVRVLFDATNLQESNRELLYRLAERAGASLVIVRTVAPDALARDRLQRRQISRDAEDLSDADELVYERMKRTEEPIRRNHFVVDTSKDVTAAVARIVREARRP